MNSIAEIQIEERHLAELAAKRHLYSKSKAALLLQMTLVIPVAIGLSIAATLIPSIQPWAALFGLLISLLDVFVLDSSQNRLTQKAAKIQEAFDCEVLGLDRPGAKIDVWPEREDVLAFAKKDLQRHPGYAGLKDWYPITTKRLPLGAARIICQRSNIRWDSDLRRYYATRLIIGLVTISLALVMVGFYQGMTLQKFVYAILAPLQPAFLWGIREYKRQQESAATLDRLFRHSTELLGKACHKSLTNDELKQASRELQSEIYEHRRTARTVFDLIYERNRERQEEEMRRAAKALVDDCLRKGCE